MLQITGATVVGTVAFSQTGLSDEEDAEVYASVPDQLTDGEEVFISSVETDVEAELIIFESEGDRSRYKVIDLEPGTEFTDRTFELEDPIPESQLISVSIQPPEGGFSYGGDRAEVTIDDSVVDPEPVDLTPEFIESDPDAGFNYPYYLYTPHHEEYEEELPLLVEPNNTGTSTDDFDEHQEAAEQLLKEGMTRELADRLRVPALVPVFPRPHEEPLDWRHYTQALDDETLAITGSDLERIDSQLLNMVDHAREHLAEQGNPVTDDGILMNGFSASGNFVDRFTVLHPDEVLSVTAGGVNGMPLLPLEEADGKELPYHVGIANVDDLIGESPDLEALDDTRQLIYMGGEDENDTIPFDDAWTDDDLRQLALDVYGDDMIDDRFARAEELYEEAGIDAEFRVYEGVGHNPGPAIDDIVEVHLETVEEYRLSDEEADEQADGEDDSAAGEQPDGEDESAAGEQPDGEDDSAADGVPGFGVGHTIAALGGAGYLIKRRVFD